MSDDNVIHRILCLRSRSLSKRSEYIESILSIDKPHYDEQAKVSSNVIAFCLAYSIECVYYAFVLYFLFHLLITIIEL